MSTSSRQLTRDGKIMSIDYQEQSKGNKDNTITLADRVEYWKSLVDKFRSENKTLEKKLVRLESEIEFLTNGAKRFSPWAAAAIGLIIGFIMGMFSG